MRTISITHGNEILAKFTVREGDIISIRKLVDSVIDDICKKKYSSYDKTYHTVSYWLLKIGQESVAVVDDILEFRCSCDISVDLGLVISDRKSINNAPLYFMDNISNS